ncbi:class II D-tagatose-bisphosphate aldolase non-catalytic subunit [Aquimarina pacifica]|uniref:class II D-tagatose-bisphosphate aldolase non-catalytic subunit n=1 Tax=Aquimarina pacifica TaxID=1296415 RepID=UPI000472B3C5|nr:class II D-tagatose-bisphosphate aldolase, non-catalytic subunit [Aquimarina pacifica]
MNKNLRSSAAHANQSLLDYILDRNAKIAKKTGVNRTIFAACPNSMAVIKAALNSAKRCNAPIKFATTLNQVDLDGGYTGLTQHQFANKVRLAAKAINLQSPVIIAIDHGGPWLKDQHRKEGMNYEQTMKAVKDSFEAAIDAGYDLIHVDPTIDTTLAKGETIKIEVVASRTVELIKHCEEYRRDKGLPKIAYEVGTEEVHGGLVDLSVFKLFFEYLKTGLKEAGLEDVWPCFVVGKVGTDLHTTEFDAQVAKTIVDIAAEYGSVIKGHYSDNVTNPEQYPLSGMGGANVGPEFTEREYEGLMELEEIEGRLFKEGAVAKRADIKKCLWDAVVDSGRWVKWLEDAEDSSDFYANEEQRQEWLVKTGCRYIWQNPEVIASRVLLYENLENNGFRAEEILLSHIEMAMDKYFYTFNLVNLNDLLFKKEHELILI